VKTTLADVPFSNRFYIMERWVVESESHPTTAEEAAVGTKNKSKRRASHITTPSSGQHKMTSCAYLTVTSEAIFTKSCPFEATIIKESAKQISDICTQWNKMAQEGLKRTEETRRQRIQEEMDLDADRIPIEEDADTAENDSAAHEADGSIEIRHMGRRNSWVAGDVYRPSPEEDVSESKTNSKCRSLVWKGKSTKQQNFARRSFSRSLSNLLSKSTRRRVSTSTTSSTDTPAVSSSVDGPASTSSNPVPIVSVA
jgi:hypothetical protein